MNSLTVKSESVPQLVSTKSEERGPTLYLNPDQTKAVFGDEKPEPGEVYETTMQFRVRGWREDEAGKPSVDLEMVACECCEGAMSESESKGEDASAGEGKD